MFCRFVHVRSFVSRLAGMLHVILQLHRVSTHYTLCFVVCFRFGFVVSRVFLLLFRHPFSFSLQFFTMFASVVDVCNMCDCVWCTKLNGNLCISPVASGTCTSISSIDGFIEFCQYMYHLLSHSHTNCNDRFWLCWWRVKRIRKRKNNLFYRFQCENAAEKSHLAINTQPSDRIYTYSTVVYS